MSGIIKQIERYRWSLIEIVDHQGFIHELRHLHDIEKPLNEGDYVTAGQIIGTMGGRGPNGSNDYAQHVHYTIRAPLGSPVNRIEDNEKPAPVDPEMFWSSFGNMAVLNIPAARLELSDPATQQRALSQNPGIIKPARNAVLSVGSRFPMVRSFQAKPSGEMAVITG